MPVYADLPSYGFMDPHPLVPDSFSRQLDRRVQEQEMPYGYSLDHAPADTGDYDSEQYESKVEYHPHRRR